MHIAFSLDAIESISPWGVPGQEQLHWYGLTAGSYRIEVGETTLFEYSDVAVSQADAPRYCEYQVARLHMDLLELLPHALDPVPEDLRPLIARDSAESWNARRRAWLDENEDSMSQAKTCDIAEFSGQWVWQRSLDAGYLIYWPQIRVWSDETMTHIEWDNRDRVMDGNPVWSASVGSYTLPKTEFVQAIEDFHRRLMNQMDERVADIVSGRRSVGCALDLRLLREEQRWRGEELQRAISASRDVTDWPLVREAIEFIRAS
jgi:hypothetical protein